MKPKGLGVRILAVGALSILSINAGQSNSPEPPSIRIPRVDRAPKLEDFVAGKPREAEAVVRQFLQREPHDGKPATQPTTAYLSYDASHLYVVFDCIADPTRLRSRVGRRDSLSGDDKVSVELDTFHDRRRAYVFLSNPAGVQMDGITTEGQEDDYSFDTVWYSEGRITSDGYFVYFSIPFKSLRFRVGLEATWGIALTRYTPDTKEFSTFPHISRRQESYVAQFATLAAMPRIRQSHNIQLMPYGFLASRRLLDDASFELPAGTSAQFIQKREARVGLDAKAVFKQSLTVDVTVNPDFSQVESDEPQVTVNQRFEVFFPERRPFFIENAGYFETPETLFFSRRIVDPQFGARLTGKVGRWAIGLLGTDDRAPLFSSNPDRQGRAAIGVARVQREFAKDSLVGGMFTSRQIGNYVNRVFGVDTRLRLNRNWVLTSQAVHSETETGRPSDRPLSGSSYFGEIRHSGKHLTYYSWYRDRSPDFRADLGFIPRVDIRNARNFAAWRWRPESGRVLNFGPSVTSYANWDYKGQLQDWFVETPFRVEFRGPTVLSFTRQEAYELYRQIGFRRNSNEVYFSTDWRRWFGVTASWAMGRSINFYPASGRQPFAAPSRDAFVGLTVRPTSRTKIDETYYYTRLAGVFNNHIWRSKVNHQFSRALAIRAILDYRGTLPNQYVVNLDRDKRLIADILLTYQLHPGTAIHAGYTNRRENYTHDLLRSGFPSLVTGSQVFVKMSYLLRL